MTVSICFEGNNLEPSALTAMLGVLPSKLHNPSHSESVCEGKLVKVGLWLWESVDSSNKMTLSDHVGIIWTTFGDGVRHAASSPNVENAWIDVGIVQQENPHRYDEANFLLDPQTFMALNNFGLPMKFTVGFTPSQIK